MPEKPGLNEEEARLVAAPLSKSGFFRFAF
jgi:hypothetical protein